MTDPSKSNDSLTSGTSADSGLGSSVSSPSILDGVLSGFQALDAGNKADESKNKPSRSQKPNPDNAAARAPNKAPFRFNQNASHFKQAVKGHFNGRNSFEGTKQSILDYFTQLGGDPAALVNNSLANSQLDELCELYCLVTRNGGKFEFAMAALFDQIVSCANVTDLSFSRRPPAVVPSTHHNPQSDYVFTADVFVPENAECNLIGRVLGPRGMSVRELEQRFKCRIFVRGNGSIRDPEKAQQLKGKPGWEHLDGQLHVHIQVRGPEKREVQLRLEEVKDFIGRLLHPQGFDAFKRRQLISLAFMNGTFRAPPQLKHLQFSASEAPIHEHRYVGN